MTLLLGIAEGKRCLYFNFHCEIPCVCLPRSLWWWAEAGTGWEGLLSSSPERSATPMWRERS